MASEFEFWENCVFVIIRLSREEADIIRDAFVAECKRNRLVFIDNFSSEYDSKESSFEVVVWQSNPLTSSGDFQKNGWWGKFQIFYCKMRCRYWAKHFNRKLKQWQQTSALHKISLESTT